tara:strand:- start:396 stop:1385 length:990 start_codon:yes stop_codon:yes gene_type:complete
MKITYYVHDLAFPLVEGIRKQAWWMALSMKHRGYEVEIVSTSKKKEVIEKEGITIRYGSAVDISNVKTDILHYLSHPSPLIVPLLMRAKAKKQVMTIFGGNLHGFWKRSWDRVVSRLVRKNVSLVMVQTKFQRELLKSTRLEKLPVTVLPPLIPQVHRTTYPSERASLLFMSHLSPFKGVDEVLRAFVVLRRKFKNLQLVICDSGLVSNEYTEKIERVNQRDIILKGKVDPIEELSKAWVYLYPIRQVQETFSVPLSFIESIQVGTPYVGSSIGGIPEYFHKDHLVEPRDVPSLVRKIEHLLRFKSVEPVQKLMVNSETIRRLIDIYVA